METWVDEFLPAGPDDEVCPRFAVTRAELRHAVERRQNLLRDMGVGPQHSVAMRQPPNLDYVVTAVAVWRLGAQLVTVDHRLPAAAFDAVLKVLLPRVVVTAERIVQMTAPARSGDDRSTVIEEAVA